MQRIDLLLVAQGLAASRTAAQALLSAGRVSIADGGVARVISKASQKFPEDSVFVIEPDEADRYVSRGGLKMAGALQQAGLEIDGWTVLDVGQSTGGFTDCVLQHGARRVVGVDVGHGQLAERLQQDERVVFFEGINARALDHEAIQAANGGELFDLMICDVSFISLQLVFPSALPMIKPGGTLLSLVKPQFEVGRSGLGHGGIVRDEKLYVGVEDRITALVNELGFQRLGWFDSPIKGGDGNREFFIHARRLA